MNSAAVTTPRSAVCAVCDFPTWLGEHCGVPVVEATVCLRRESTVRPDAFRLICGASLREQWHVGEDGIEQVNCPDCRRILAREARTAA